MSLKLEHKPIHSLLETPEDCSVLCLVSCIVANTVILGNKKGSLQSRGPFDV